MIRLADILMEQLSFASNDKPKAYIIPHAAPQYSGHIALEVIKNIPNHDYNSILILGINHKGGAPGIYVGSEYNPDADKINKIKDSGLKEVEGDHSIGWILPLIESFSNLPIIPIVITDYNPKISKILKNIIDDQTLIIASTDLSHHKPLPLAGKIDHMSITNIKNENPIMDACGKNAVRTLYDLIDERLELVDYDTSAHLEGNKEEVVGYAAFQAGGFSPDLLAARDSVLDFIEGTQITTQTKNKKAAFIGISKNGELQGSMGQTKPMFPSNIAAVQAFKSTLTDGRMQYSPEEIMTPGNEFEVKVRLFSDMKPANLENVILGRDGLYVESEGKSGVFLPEVPTKEQWDLPTYLKELLKKAQITDNRFDLYKFQTESIMIIT